MSVYQSSHPEPSDDDSAGGRDDGPFLDALRAIREGPAPRCRCGEPTMYDDHDNFHVNFWCRSCRSWTCVPILASREDREADRGDEAYHERSF